MAVPLDFRACSPIVWISMKSSWSLFFLLEEPRESAAGQIKRPPCILSTLSQSK